jgi:hypothetical protein
MLFLKEMFSSTICLLTIMNPFYWQLCWFDGQQIRKKEIEYLSQFLDQRIASLEENSDVLAQALLINMRNKTEADRISASEAQMAENCLRCYISHQIKYVCITLEQKYRERHGLRRQDLYSLVLYDTLEPIPLAHGSDQAEAKDGAFVPLWVRILDRFNPKKGDLRGWTYRITQDDPEVRQLLLDHEILRVTHWALLNDMETQRLRRILVDSPGINPPVSEAELVTAQRLLEGYHAVYRRDRIRTQGANSKKTCEQPNQAQLTRIGTMLQGRSGQCLEPEGVFEALLALADSIRRYRIYRLGGSVRSTSLDEERSDAASRLGSIAAPEQDPTDQEHDSFLAAFRALYKQHLRAAIQAAIDEQRHKHEQKEEELASQYLEGLHLFYCQGQSMGKLAAAIGLKGQVQVTRFLKTTPLLEEVSQKVLLAMTDTTIAQAEQYLDPDQLLGKHQEIMTALQSLTSDLVDQAKAEASTPKNRACNSDFARSLCQHLETLRTP